MPLQIIERDITTMKVDAIVNSTNHHMIGWSGVDQLLHEKGGPAFEAECEALDNVNVPGGAVYTNAYNLDCKYIIHTMAPTWVGGIHGEAAILRSAYRSSLALAEELGCKSIAFPLLSAGHRHYPIAEAIKEAVTSINEHLQLYTDMEVYLVLYGSVIKSIAENIYGGLDEYIAQKYKQQQVGPVPSSDNGAAQDEKISLEDKLNNPGESFVDMLYRFMDQRQIKNAAQLYKKAGMNKAAYSKLISGKTAKPSLPTAVGLAMALELPYDDAIAFLKSAGIALSESSTYDIIVDYFLRTGDYDIWKLDVQLVRLGYKAILGSE